MKTSYFPAFLDIRGRKCVVVGGGNVAAQKIRALLKCDASVVVVSNRLKASVRRLVRSGSIGWVRRDFAPRDLRGAFLAIAATDQAAVNRSVWEAACRGRILANVVDDPVHCHFIVPSIFKRGRLHIAVSTGGSSPALAKRIRKELGNVFGPEHALALDWMGRARQAVFRRVPSLRLRKALFSALAATDIPGGIKRWGRANAKRKFDRRLEELLLRFGNYSRPSPL